MQQADDPKLKDKVHPVFDAELETYIECPVCLEHIPGNAEGRFVKCRQCSAKLFIEGPIA